MVDSDLAMRAGQVIGKGQFRLRRLIARGGMGEVYLADRPDGTQAAVKFIRSAEDATDEDLAMLRARFQREAKIAKALVSEHIAKVLYAGRTQKDDLFIAFEYLDGESLAERLTRDSTIGMSDLAWIVSDVLDGLRVAHEADVVHRDIKPGNIFLETSPRRAKILDFGIAKRAHASDTSSATAALTEVGTAVGTSTFMAPEQLAGTAHVDARADLYALGVVAFKCLTGKLPFVGGRPPTARKRSLPALSLADVTGQAWPRETESFMRQCLERDPDDRFASAAAARDAWRACSALAHPSVRVRVSTNDTATEDGRTTTE